MRVHPSITTDRISEAVEESYTSTDNPGFCIACGEEQEGCEPDAEKYLCESCGKHEVYGAENLLLMIM